MAKRKLTAQYLLCINNDSYAASLDVRKVYRQIPDPVAEARKFVRIIDESGEDYLFPANRFIPIELPRAATTVFVEAS